MKTRCQFLSALSLLASLGLAHAEGAFTEVTNGAIVTDTGPFVGALWGDFHNDGWLDLYVSGYGGVNVFYRNNGDGTFTAITGTAPVQDIDYHTLPATGDIDNDGYLDLIVPAGIGAPVARHCLFYHNNGDGSFTPISGGAVTNQAGFFGNASWVDYDNDGFIDLFVAGAGDSQGAVGKSLLFHNNGDGTFNQITTGNIVNDLGIGYGVLWTDYDNDGYVDLVVNNLVNNGHSFVYHNNRDGTFAKILISPVATDVWPSGSAGGAWGDYDNDGLPDLFVTGANGANRLYHNQGGGVFTNVASGPMLHLAGANYCGGCAWGDYDNDGYLDLFVINSPGPNGLFHNNGDGTFKQILSEGPVTNVSGALNENALAWVDYDNDGYLDLFFSRATSDGGPFSNLLYHNNGNSNGWVEIKLAGAIANRSAIGAKVRVLSTIGGKTFWQLREITSGGAWDCHPLVAHFGLGDATNINTLRIEWPSGTVQEFQNLAPRQILTITEPPRLLAGATNGAPHFFLKAWTGLKFDIQKSPDLTSWSFLGTVTSSNLNGLTEIIDTNGFGSDHMFYRAASH